MGYFPFFVDLTGKQGLLVGGGTVALRKLERLLPFGPEMTVAAPEILPEIQAMSGIQILRRPFSPEILDGKFFVIAASDDRALNHEIADLCRARGIPVNAVDDRAACTFLFPALVQAGPLTVGISTGGASPSAAIYIRNLLQTQLPENFPEILEYLEAQRAPVQARYPGPENEKRRAEIFAELFAACLETGRPPAPEALQEILRSSGAAAPRGQQTWDTPLSAPPPAGQTMADMLDAGIQNSGSAAGQSPLPLCSPPEAGNTTDNRPRNSGAAGGQDSPRAGRVYLVGAGCGAADLITVRGLRLLQRCDAVVYDDLIDAALLDEVPAAAARIYVGKRAGAHAESQERIHEILAALAREGKTVVRLKGGDPYVFGRGGEEMQAMQALGIPCETVPGITSATAIPEEAGIPVTHRGISRSMYILTGQTAETADGLPPELDGLAQLPGTLVILMGLRNLPAIAARLLAAGKPPDTPAAVISGGNAPRPCTVRGTLADIAARAAQAGVTAPAVTVIGETAALNL